MKMTDMDVLNGQQIKNCLHTRWAAKEVIFLDKTTSTNVEAWRMAKQGFPHGSLIVTDSQTEGKGRRGRTWHMSEGSAIAMSMIVKPDMEAEYASMVTLVQAMATAKAIEEVCELKTQIKWPNDILINEKKVCGILTEMNLEKTSLSFIIIGTGINVNQKSFPKEIADIATSLRIEKNQLQSRAELIKRICELFEIYFEEFMVSKNCAAFLEEYNARLVSKGRRVKVMDPQGEFCGEALGINPKGELLVKSDSGEISKVYAGEVSVRGIYGYV